MTQVGTLPSLKKSYRRSKERLKSELSKTKTSNAMLLVMLVCSLVYSIFTTYEWRSMNRYAERSLTLGYLTAQVDMVTGQFVRLNIDQVNQAIISLQAESRHLGYNNPDTLRYYKIKPWEDYRTK